MEHFHISPEAAHCIRAPYLGKTLYDRGSFHRYPDRAGWKRQELRVGYSLISHSRVDAEAFLQTWLYFGMLVTVFKVGGVEVQEADFLTKEKGKVYLTTQLLKSRIALWENKWPNKDKSSQSQEAWTKTKAVLDEVQEEIKHLGALPCPNSDSPWAGAVDRPPSSSLVSEETLTAVTALLYTLSEVAISLYSPEWNRYYKYIAYSTDLIKDRLVANGWCPLDIQRMLTELGMDAHYYFTLLKSPNRNQHSRCSETLCVAANIVDESTYRPRHTSTCAEHTDENSRGAGERATKQVVDIIEQNGIPVVRWQRREGKPGFELRIRDARAHRLEYVAISHV